MSPGVRVWRRVCDIAGIFASLHSTRYKPVMLLASIEWWHLLAILVLGLVAGIGGGMLGVGGSIIMIPGLVLLFGQDRIEGFNQHVYQAAAMIANVAVSVPAAVRHYRAGATIVAALKFMLPVALLTVLLGVYMSNLPIFRGTEGSIWLGRVLGVFLIYVIVVNIQRLGGRHATVEQDAQPRITAAPAVAVGSVMGLTAGLMGIGGGAIAVPLQQLLMRIPLRRAIANSSAIICISAAVGAVYKNATLHDPHGLRWEDSLILAALLAPSCWLGGHLGAILTHALPLRLVRIALIIFMAVAAVRMFHLPLSR